MDVEPLIDTAANDEVVFDNSRSEVENSDASSSGLSNYLWEVFRASINSFVHTLIGVCVFVTLWFAFKSTPLTTFQIHIALNVVGYQLLMSHAILSLDPFNGWSRTLTSSHRRRAHWILQLVGSVAAITGSILMMRQKSVNFNTLHGKLALASLILTSISLLNGLSSMYAEVLPRFIPTSVSKISHVLLGTSAFTLSSVCLATGFNKGSFKEWASKEIAYAMIGITSTFTVLIILMPFRNFWRKVGRVLKIKIF